MTDQRWIKVAGREDVEAAGGLLGVSLEGKPLALYAVDGKIYATADLCTHGNARLSDGYLDGHLIECPLHQGLFDVRTGAPAGEPCTEAVRSFSVMEQDGAIFVAAEG